jgi:hypothetical protein
MIDPELSLNVNDFNELSLNFSSYSSDTIIFRQNEFDLPQSTRIEIDLQWLVDSTSIGHATIDNLGVEILDVETQLDFANFVNSQGVTEFAKSFTSSKFSTAIVGEFIRMSGFVELPDSVFSFDGLTVSLSMPMNQVNLNSNTSANISYFLDSSSYIRFSYYYFAEANPFFGNGHRNGKLLVYDNEYPSFKDSCPGNISVLALLDSNHSAEIEWIVPVATDNLNYTLTEQSKGPLSGSNFSIGTTPVSYTASDRYGNEAVCRFYVTVKDEQV